ncbi:fatty acid synthase alpha subunit Lsd1, partial [Coemansia sp. RSA 1822]
MELELGRIDENSIVLTVHHETVSGNVVLLKLEYSYCRGCILAPIHSSKVQNDEVIRQFYIEAARNNPSAPETKPDDPESELSLAISEFVITKDHVRSFCRNVKNLSRHYVRTNGGHLRAPMEFMSFPVSCAMIWFLTSQRFGHGQFNVVHLSARVELNDGAQMVSVGEVLEGTASITGLYNLPIGKVMTVTSVIRRQGVPVATLVSSTLARGYYISPSAAFQRVSGQKMAIMLYSEEDIAILESKQWFYYHEDTATRLQPNVIIEFCLDTEYRYLTDTAFSTIITKGSVAIKLRTGKRVDVGAVDFQWGAAKGNPVIEYLERHKIDTSATMFGDGGYELTAISPEYLTKAIVPNTSHEYARLSFDRNPIHTNPYIADMAGLPETITHGMWTSASTRAVVEQVAAKDCPERIRMYQTEFT